MTLPIGICSNKTHAKFSSKCNLVTNFGDAFDQIWRVPQGLLLEWLLEVWTFSSSFSPSLPVLLLPQYNKLDLYWLAWIVQLTICKNSPETTSLWPSKNRLQATWVLNASHRHPASLHCLLTGAISFLFVFYLQNIAFEALCGKDLSSSLPSDCQCPRGGGLILDLWIVAFTLCKTTRTSVQTERLKLQKAAPGARSWKA